VISTTAEAQARIPARYPLTSEQITSYHRNGWVLLPQVIDPQHAQLLREEILGIMEVIGLPQTCLRQTSEFLRHGHLHHFVHAVAIRELASRLIGGNAHLYGPFTAVKSPGGGPMHFHQDNQYTPHDGPSINLWTAMEAVDEHNGCLRVVSGSHLAGTLPAVAAEENHRRTADTPQAFDIVRMQPGDCVAFSRLTLHASGPNLTTVPRVAYAVQYHREDVRAQWDENGWVRLIDRPRWTFGPVDQLSRPEGPGE
jgi:hypothetical protein